ncbi:hypothetical protein ACI0X9_003395 [Cronobacter turicensis]
MTHLTDDVIPTNIASQMMQKFVNKIGTKQEPLFWGVKAKRETLLEIGATLSCLVDGKKILRTLVLHEQPVISNDKTPYLTRLGKKTVVFIQCAEDWDQEILLKSVIQIAQAGSKALIGFSDIGALSMGIYQFMVAQQIEEDGQIRDWAINMSVPLRELK